MRLFVLLSLIRLFPIDVIAWEGMPTPPLHVEGNQLKDPTGKSVRLFGWMQPTASWFHGGGRWYNDPSNWNDSSNVAGFLNYMKDAATLMSDTTPKYGQNHGWYASFVRLNTDAIGGWNHQLGLYDTSQFHGWIQNFLVPYADHLRSRGLYLILCAVGPINTPNNGTRNAGVVEQQRLRTFWSTVANAPGVKNADNIHFELMNEPVEIESSPGNGDWGMGQNKYFEAFRNWIQPVIDDIRNTGANNVIWVPTLEWQGSPHQHVLYPFTCTNCGIAAHYYPAYGGCYDDVICHNNLWNRQYKPATDLWPMIITENFWFPENEWGLVGGSTANYGNTLRANMAKAGNVSYLVGFLGDLLGNLNDALPADASLSLKEGAQSFFTWLPTYTWAAPDDGTPKFRYASVTDSNPKQIKVLVSHSVQELGGLGGFTVQIDGQAVGVESVALGDTTNQLVINVSDSILNDNEVLLSYSNGNVVSIYGKALENFKDIVVNNLLEGAAPRIIALTINEDGNKLIVRFNMKMRAPTDLSDLTLNAQYNGNISVLNLSSAALDNDSTSLVFPLEDQVYAEYQLLLSYSGDNIASSRGGLLKTFPNLPVTNRAKGLPLQIESGRVEADGITAILELSKPIAIAVGQSKYFTLKADGGSVSIRGMSVQNNTIRLTLRSLLRYEDTVTLSYTPGIITATDRGALEGFSDFPLTNLMSEPETVSIPSRIEAENHYLQSGTQTENTSDVGGGLNVGYIDDGDWLLYSIENNSDKTNFEISFRVASPNSDGIIDVLLNNSRNNRIAVPNTGGWQRWQSITGIITIGPGQHYLTINAQSGGFNINYIDIKLVETGVEDPNAPMLLIYPNPASNMIVIRSTGDFQYSKIEIIDAMGKVVLSRSDAYEPELHLPVSLADGVYILKVSNEKEYKFKKVIIRNE